MSKPFGEDIVDQANTMSLSEDTWGIVDQQPAITDAVVYATTPAFTVYSVEYLKIFNLPDYPTIWLTDLFSLAHESVAAFEEIKNCDSKVIFSKFMEWYCPRLITHAAKMQLSFITTAFENLVQSTCENENKFKRKYIKYDVFVKNLNKLNAKKQALTIFRGSYVNFLGWLNKLKTTYNRLNGHYVGLSIILDVEIQAIRKYMCKNIETIFQTCKSSIVHKEISNIIVDDSIFKTVKFSSDHFLVSSLNNTFEDSSCLLSQFLPENRNSIRCTIGSENGVCCTFNKLAFSHYLEENLNNVKNIKTTEIMHILENIGLNFGLNYVMKDIKIVKQSVQLFSLTATVHYIEKGKDVNEYGLFNKNVVVLELVTPYFKTKKQCMLLLCKILCLFILDNHKFNSTLICGKTYNRKINVPLTSQPHDEDFKTMPKKDKKPIVDRIIKTVSQFKFCKYLSKQKDKFTIEQLEIAQIWLNTAKSWWCNDFLKLYERNVQIVLDNDEYDYDYDRAIVENLCCIMVGEVCVLPATPQKETTYSSIFTNILWRFNYYVGADIVHAASKSEFKFMNAKIIAKHVTTFLNDGAYQEILKTPDFLQQVGLDISAYGENKPKQKEKVAKYFEETTPNDKTDSIVKNIFNNEEIIKDNNVTQFEQSPIINNPIESNNFKFDQFVSDITANRDYFTKSKLSIVYTAITKNKLAAIDNVTNFVADHLFVLWSQHYRMDVNNIRVFDVLELPFYLGSYNMTEFCYKPINVGYIMSQPEITSVLIDGRTCRLYSYVLTKGEGDLILRPYLRVHDKHLGYQLPTNDNNYIQIDGKVDLPFCMDMWIRFLIPTFDNPAAWALAATLNSLSNINITSYFSIITVANRQFGVNIKSTNSQLSQSDLLTMKQLIIPVVLFLNTIQNGVIGKVIGFVFLIAKRFISGVTSLNDLLNLMQAHEPEVTVSDDKPEVKPFSLQLWNIQDGSSKIEITTEDCLLLDELKVRCEVRDSEKLRIYYGFTKFIDEFRDFNPQMVLNCFGELPPGDSILSLVNTKTQMSWDFNYVHGQNVPVYNLVKIKPELNLIDPDEYIIPNERNTDCALRCFQLLKNILVNLNCFKEDVDWKAAISSLAKSPPNGNLLRILLKKLHIPLIITKSELCDENIVVNAIHFYVVKSPNSEFGHCKMIVPSNLVTLLGDKLVSFEIRGNANYKRLKVAKDELNLEQQQFLLKQLQLENVNVDDRDRVQVLSNNNLGYYHSIAPVVRDLKFTYYNNSPIMYELAMLTRFMPARKSPTKLGVNRLRECITLVKGHFSSNWGDYSTKFDSKFISDWLFNQKPVYRERLKNMHMDYYNNTSWKYVFESFLKGELKEHKLNNACNWNSTLEDNDINCDYKPRIVINSQTTNALVGPSIKYLSEKMLVLINNFVFKDFRIHCPKKLDSVEQGSLYTQLRTFYGKSAFVVEVDQTGMERNICKLLLDFEVDLFSTYMPEGVFLYPEVEMFVEILKKNLSVNTTGTFYKDFFTKISYWLLYYRLSGCSYTTDGNCIINLIIHLAIFKHLKKLKMIRKMDAVVLGDDGYFFVNPLVDKNKLLVEIKYITEQIGFDTKILIHEFPFYKVGFCSQLFYPIRLNGTEAFVLAPTFTSVFKGSYSARPISQIEKYYKHVVQSKFDCDSQLLSSIMIYKQYIKIFDVGGVKIFDDRYIRLNKLYTLEPSSLQFEFNSVNFGLSVSLQLKLINTKLKLNEVYLPDIYNAAIFGLVEPRIIPVIGMQYFKFTGIMPNSKLLKNSSLLSGSVSSEISAGIKDEAVNTSLNYNLVINNDFSNSNNMFYNACDNNFYNHQFMNTLICGKYDDLISETNCIAATELRNYCKQRLLPEIPDVLVPDPSLQLALKGQLLQVKFVSPSVAVPPAEFDYYNSTNPSNPTVKQSKIALEQGSFSNSVYVTSQTGVAIPNFCAGNLANYTIGNCIIPVNLAGIVGRPQGAATFTNPSVFSIAGGATNAPQLEFHLLMNALYPQGSCPGFGYVDGKLAKVESFQYYTNPGISKLTAANQFVQFGTHWFPVNIAQATNTLSGVFNFVPIVNVRTSETFSAGATMILRCLSNGNEIVDYYYNMEVGWSYNIGINNLTNANVPGFTIGNNITYISFMITGHSGTVGTAVVDVVFIGCSTNLSATGGYLPSSVLVGKALPIPQADLAQNGVTSMSLISASVRATCVTPALTANGIILPYITYGGQSDAWLASNGSDKYSQLEKSTVLQVNNGAYTVLMAPFIVNMTPSGRNHKYQNSGIFTECQPSTGLTNFEYTIAMIFQMVNSVQWFNTIPFPVPNHMVEEANQLIMRSVLPCENSNHLKAMWSVINGIGAALSKAAQYAPAVGAAVGTVLPRVGSVITTTTPVLKLAGESINSFSKEQLKEHRSKNPRQPKKKKDREKGKNQAPSIGAGGTSGNVITVGLEEPKPKPPKASRRRTPKRAAAWTIDMGYKSDRK